ncbi:type II toxin-antitoxin system VapC family toxin [Endothiovibrio diazotrophicus]
MILLDTHILIWTLLGEPVSDRAKEAIREAASVSALFVSVVTAWEVGMLESKGRFVPTKGALEWFREAMALPGLRLVPLDSEVAIRSASLPDGFHGDPADRMLVETARARELTLITRDRKILAYGHKGWVRVLEG